MKIHELTRFLDQSFPLGLQEEYDNAGFLVGNKEQELTGVLISVDVTEQVVDEAIERGANFVLSHHPVIFSGMNKITGKNYVERIVMKAIKHDVAIYAAHTNMDNAGNGVNIRLAEKLGLQDVQILRPDREKLVKLAFFVPHEQAGEVREAVFRAGAGQIGDYDSCSYNLSGQGTFRPGEGTNPFVGKQGELHFEDETRVETIFPEYIQPKVLDALFKAHPYEEVAYDLYPLKNENPGEGSGAVGILPAEMEESRFLTLLSKTFDAPGIRHTSLLHKPVKKVALCGGSGSFLLKDAIRAGADAFMSADFKYHQFFDADGQILIADIGHYESEQVTKEIFYELLTENFHNFAIHLSKINTNPINYF